ncbi:uncharacterized protein ARMOST_18182 [Armillaria ostoyae]|uniref:Ubiquitin-like domain-containing protein n=1 Tax=Armillaria ostoyae TaxID=47428 RepID=A0A284S134_ARMOS|nr:uncharacterized protein ARMOST_18182 [Armillaria ostoyae]
MVSLLASCYVDWETLIDLILYDFLEVSLRFPRGVSYSHQQWVLHRQKITSSLLVTQTAFSSVDRTSASTTTSSAFYRNISQAWPRTRSSSKPIDKLEVCAGEYIDIADGLWPETSLWIHGIRVISRPRQISTSASPSQSMKIIVLIRIGKTFTFSISSFASVSNVKELLRSSQGIPPDQQRLIFEGKQLEDGCLLSEYGIKNEATIPLVLRLPGGKPVIYLFTPLPLTAVVRLSLVKSWSFSAVYPGVPIKSSEAGQSTEWNVNTHEDHTITDIATGARVSYLFWETETNHGLPPSPPSYPRLCPSHSDANAVFPFDPSLAELTDRNSVVLPTSKTALYFDKALTALGLHVEATTSFIAYWLPPILKHDFVALRFLPQASYEHAAPLDVEPKLDVVIRVFMLFMRVGVMDIG